MAGKSKEKLPEFTLEEAAEFVEVSKEQLEYLVAEGKLRAEERLGGETAGGKREKRRYFHRIDMLKYLDANLPIKESDWFVLMIDGCEPLKYSGPELRSFLEERDKDVYQTAAEFYTDMRDYHDFIRLESENDFGLVLDAYRKKGFAEAEDLLWETGNRDAGKMQQKIT